MIYISNFAKPNFVFVFAFTYARKSFIVLHGDFSMDSYSVDSDEVMKCVVEVLNDSSLQFF